MHPGGFRIPGIQQQHQQQMNNMMQNHHHHQNGTSTTSLNQNINVEQVIHQNLFMDHHQQQQQQQLPFLPMSHNYMIAEGAGASSAYYPVNFKLGLNEINCTSSKSNQINGDDDEDMVRGSEHHREATRHTCLEMHNQHCWPQDSSSIIKQTTQQFWEPHPAEVSNENSEIIDRLEKSMRMNQKLPYQRGSNTKETPRYGELGELEAVYKQCGTSTTIVNQAADEMLPCGQGQEQGSDGASIDASVCLKDDDNKKKMKKKKKKQRVSSSVELAEFFEKLVKQVVDHQENLYTKFVERVERLDAARMEKEAAWRSKESVYFEQQAAARAHEKAMAMTRDDTIVSYLEKITGENIPSLPSFNPNC